jgi:beta-carotene hydroxylase
LTAPMAAPNLFGPRTAASLIMSEKPQNDWPTITLLGTMYVLLAVNFWLYFTRPLAFPIHFLVSATAIHFAFTIWHESAHRSVSSRRVVNDVVGVLGMLPYMTPFFIQKYVHMQHHKYMNEPSDPNLIYTDGRFLTIPFRYVRALGYAKKVLERDPRSAGEKGSDYATLMLLASVYGAAIWHGVFVDLLLVWFAPLVFAKLVMDWYINYIPHAGLPAHRYGGTRILDIWWLTPLVLGHNYHAIHHLWPDIPWYRYLGVFRQRREHLKEHGVPIETRIRGISTSARADQHEDTRAR